MNFLEQHNGQIVNLCETNEVKSLFLFGSAITGSFRDDSDIDLVVDFDEKDPISYSNKYFSLKFQLEDLLKRKVDLLEQKAIRNKFLIEEINKTKIRIYGK